MIKPISSTPAPLPWEQPNSKPTNPPKSQPLLRLPQLQQSILRNDRLSKKNVKKEGLPPTTPSSKKTHQFTFKDFFKSLFSCMPPVNPQKPGDPLVHKLIKICLEDPEKAAKQLRHGDPFILTLQKAEQIVKPLGPKAAFKVVAAMIKQELEHTNNMEHSLLVTKIMIKVFRHHCFKQINGTRRNEFSSLVFRLLGTTSATKLKAVYKGWKARQRVVLPNQILPFLKKHLLGKYDDAQLLNITRALCREINVFSAQPHLYKGTSLRLNKLKPNLHDFPVFSDNQWKSKETLKLNFDCWIEMSQNGKKISLLIIPPDEQLGSGSYQIVNKAQQFELSLRLQNPKERPLTYLPKVLKQPNTKRTDPENQHKVIPKTPQEQIDDNNTILAGLTIHQKLLDEFKNNPNVKLVGIPRQLNSASNGHLQKNLESEQEWYNADLFAASRHKGIPLTLEKNPPMRPFTIKDKFNVCLQVAASLENMHSKGYIHRDIKPPNILLKLNAKDVVEGYISDFDLTTRQGKGISSNYQYWDLCGRDGWVTPFSDCYGLILTLGEILSPSFTEIRDYPDLKLGNAERHTTKCNLLKAHIVQKLKTTSNALDECVNADDIHNWLGTQPAYLQAILKPEINAIDATFDLLHEVYEKNKIAYNYLQGHREIQDQLNSWRDSERAQARDTLAKISFSMAALRHRMSLIYDKLDSDLRG